MGTTASRKIVIAMALAGGVLLAAGATGWADPPGRDRGSSRGDSRSDNRGGDWSRGRDDSRGRSDARDRGRDDRSRGDWDRGRSRSDRSRGDWNRGGRDYRSRYPSYPTHRSDDDRLRVRVQIGGPVVQTVRQWVPGHYESVTEQVLIVPERTEKRWIEPVTERRYPSNGEPYTVVIEPGHWETIITPARYETRITQVYVPGRYEEVRIVTHDPSPRITVGGVIVF